MAHCVRGRTLRLPRRSPTVGNLLDGGAGTDDRSVCTLSISGDGSKMLSAGNGSNALLWNLSCGSSDRELDAEAGGHMSGVLCVAVSVNGSLLASGSKDDTIVVWDVGEAIALMRLWGHIGNVSCLMFSDDATKLLSGSWDQTLILWNLRDGTQAKRFESGHTSAILACALSSDMVSAISLSRVGKVCVWNMGTFEGPPTPTQSFVTGSPNRSLCLVIPSSGPCSWLLVGSGASMLLWDFGDDVTERSDDEDISTLPRGADTHGTFQAMPSDSVLPKTDHTALRVRIPEQCPRRYGMVSSAATPRDANFTVPRGTTVACLSGQHTHDVTSAALARENTLLVTGCRGGIIVEWDLGSRSALRRWSHRLWTENGIVSLDIDRLGVFLLIASGSGVVSCRRIGEEEPSAVWPCSHRAESVRLTPSGDLVTFGCHDGVVHMHELDNGQPLNSTLQYNWGLLLQGINSRRNLLEPMLRANPGLIRDRLHLNVSQHDDEILDWSLCHYCAAVGDLEALRTIFRTAGVTPLGFLFDRRGRTPLDLARNYDNREVLEFFLERARDWPPTVCELNTRSICDLMPENLRNMPSFLDAQVAAPAAHHDVVAGVVIEPPTWALLDQAQLTTRLSHADPSAEHIIIGSMLSEFTDASPFSYHTSGVAPLLEKPSLVRRLLNSCYRWCNFCYSCCCSCCSCCCCCCRRYCRSVIRQRSFDENDLGNTAEHVDLEQAGLVSDASVKRTHGDKIMEVARLGIIDARQVPRDSTLRVVPILTESLYLADVLHPRYCLIERLMESSDPQLLRSKTVQALLHLIWNTRGRSVYQQNSALWLGMLLTYLVFCLLVLSANRGTIEKTLVLIFGLVAACLSAVFVWKEVEQLRKAGAYYFANGWNWLDFISLSLVQITVFLGGGIKLLHSRAPEWLPWATAICTVLLFFGCFFYLRGVREFGSLIRMLQEIAGDMRWFMLIMMLAMIALVFGLHFIRSPGWTDGLAMFAELKSTLLEVYHFAVHGNYATEIFTSADPATAILFFCLSLFVVILMLNLLIALMGDTFARVKSTELVAFLRERLDLLHDLQVIRCDDPTVSWGGYVIFSEPLLVGSR
eukprot:TRINITY_DN11851_c0_g2_i1.p1 TRINITY_DN11851_c0_g2~~TRINITY_DN11851_c0_g2_i1.p1  ORF type:complete len:1256 (-),score=145.33 TRINITY_DN11851_c0_g2_i1:87-3365(-)